jgi:hypothetical protein
MDIYLHYVEALSLLSMIVHSEEEEEEEQVGVTKITMVVKGEESVHEDERCL